jgi:hypothetical protein
MGSTSFTLGMETIQATKKSKNPCYPNGIPLCQPVPLPGVSCLEVGVVVEIGFGTAFVAAFGACLGWLFGNFVVQVLGSIVAWIIGSIVKRRMSM